MVKIKELPISDRPIERLIEKGVENLGNDELLAILLRTGNKKYSSKELASQILSEIGGISNLKDVTLSKLIQIDGMGIVKASVIISALELSRRVDNENKILYSSKINNALLVFNYYKNILKNKKQECFYCIYLDSTKKVVANKLLFIGTLNHSMVHPREVFKEAYLVGATSIICIHNHPSGEIKPSKMDIILTEELVKIGKILGINIDDHLIIGNDKYYSFFENNILKN